MRARKNAGQFANEVLRVATPTIKDRFGSDFLAGEQYYPAGPEEYGRGGFSSVLPCRRPGLVMKVTIDGSEAFLVEVLRLLGPMPGLPRYAGEAMKLECGDEPAWIVWRQDLPGPDLKKDESARYDAFRKMMPYEARFAIKRSEKKDYDDRYKKLAAKLGLTEIKRLEEAQQCGLAVASLLSQVTGKGGDVQEFQRLLFKYQDFAAKIFDPEESWGQWWRYAKGENDMSSEQTAALRILGYEFQLSWLRMGTVVPHLADSLLKLLNAGVMVCDVQPDNVSTGVTPYTLFDGGFTLPLTARWNGLWEDVGAIPRRWWDWKLKERAMESWAFCGTGSEPEPSQYGTR